MTANKWATEKWCMVQLEIVRPEEGLPKIAGQTKSQWIKWTVTRYVSCWNPLVWRNNPISKDQSVSHWHWTVYMKDEHCWSEWIQLRGLIQCLNLFVKFIAFKSEWWANLWFYSWSSPKSGIKYSIHLLSKKSNNKKLSGLVLGDKTCMTFTFEIYSSSIEITPAIKSSLLWSVCVSVSMSPVGKTIN